MLDIDIIEQKVLELFLSVADRTRVELEQFSHPRCAITEYHTGEVTGPGSLVCMACGQMVHFNTTSHIPPCPKCHASVYHRGRP